MPTEASRPLNGTGRGEPAAKPPECRDPKYHHEDGSWRWGGGPAGLPVERWAAVVADHRRRHHNLGGDE